MWINVCLYVWIITVETGMTHFNVLNTNMMKIIIRNYIIFIIIYIITADLIGIKAATPIVLKPLTDSHFIMFFFDTEWSRIQK